MDNIFALSSGALPSALAVIRISGPLSLEIVKKLTNISSPTPNTLQYSKFINPADKAIIDTGMVVYFQKPASFTGEDAAEFHLHGSKAVISLFLSCLAKFENCRLAEPGEFSRRAYLNGKIDLLQAEFLADLLESETEAQRRLSIHGTTKQLSNLYSKWHEKLLNSMAYLTAELDFADEEDITSLNNDSIWQELKNLSSSMQKHLFYAKSSDIIKNGFRIVFVGKPNVGKSSLLNKICGKDIAIVSDKAGTTRDILEGKIILNGVNIFFYDTAGIRKTNDEVEKIGIEKTKSYIEEADLIFHLQDNIECETIDFTQPVWNIHTKCDVSRETCEQNKYFISIYREETIKKLLCDLAKHIENITHKYQDSIPIKHRHINLLNDTICDINIAIENKNLPIEVRAEYIRTAANNIGRIIGKIDVENILDVVFSSFCIGK